MCGIDYYLSIKASVEFPITLCWEANLFCIKRQRSFYIALKLHISLKEYFYHIQNTCNSVQCWCQHTWRAHGQDCTQLVEQFRLHNSISNLTKDMWWQIIAWEPEVECKITWKMDKTVTGSVADIRAPNIRHSTNGSLYMRYIIPPR